MQKDKSFLFERGEQLLADLKELEEVIERESNTSIDFSTRQEIIEKRTELNYIRQHLGPAFAAN